MSEGITNIPKTRVELHVHLDGSIRHETIWELLKQKNLPLPGTGTFKDLRTALIVRDPIDLGHFLAPFAIFMPAVQNDFQAIERIAYEFCEDKANQHVAYVEARYSPHGFLTGENLNLENCGEVIASIQRGFDRAENDFGIKARHILCTLIGNNTAEEVLQLCQIHRDKGVVAIDTAGTYIDTDNNDEVPLNTKEAEVFAQASTLGIHRTVHAGERGPAEMVRRAVEIYKAERIGHGYHVIEDQNIYSSCLKKNIHFECCPWSSFLTGAVPLGIKKHPVAVFADDKANFSLNTDDTTITGYELNDDYRLAQKWSFTEANLIQANLNAAKSCFLPDDEKELLIKQIKSNLGLDEL